MTDQNEENECTRDGVRYVFVVSKSNDCLSCAGHLEHECYKFPQCFWRFRADKKTGIWKRKEPQQ